MAKAAATPTTPPPIPVTETTTAAARPVVGAIVTPSPGAIIKKVISKPEQLKFDGPQYILDSGKVFHGIRIAGFKGYVPYTAVPAGKATMEWEGGKLSSALWHQICAFFEWTQAEFKSEGQVRLFYNRENRKWAAWAFPQECAGMTTKELPDDPQTAIQRTQFPPPWELMGTVHHHCTMNAFQSGTDTHNESTQEGVHITVGGVSTDEYSVHGRVIVRANQYEINWAEWFHLPEALRAALPLIPVKMHGELLTGSLKSPPAKDLPFPEVWKTNCSKPKYTVTTTRGNWDAESSTTRTGRTTYLISADLKSQFTAGELDFMKEAEMSYTQGKWDHTKADTIFAEDKDKLSEEEWTWVCGMIELARKFNVTQERADELFDKWDFTVVLDELKYTRV